MDQVDGLPGRTRPLFATDVSTPRQRPVRVPFRLPVAFREKRRIRADARGVVVNVSETGLYIAIRHPPGIHDIVLLSLPGAAIDGQPQSLKVRGQVRWWRTSRARPDESLGFGVKILDFDSVQQRERYLAFVHRLLSDAGPGAPASTASGPSPEGEP